MQWRPQQLSQQQALLLLLPGRHSPTLLQAV
jgi:hypothetical protein